MSREQVAQETEDMCRYCKRMVGVDALRMVEFSTSKSWQRTHMCGDCEDRINIAIEHVLQPAGSSLRKEMLWTGNQ